MTSRVSVVLGDVKYGMDFVDSVPTAAQADAVGVMVAATIKKHYGLKDEEQK